MVDDGYPRSVFALCGVWLVLGPYFAALVVLSGLSIHRARLARAAWRARRRVAPPLWPTTAPWPEVLVQLPLYNEPFVAERAVRAVGALQLPGGRPSIQVLDDSTDETSAIVRGVVDELRAAGVRIEHVHRATREGWKAGALQAGLAASDAAFVAIFDADFMPPPDFLLRALPPLLAEPRVGLVQARWSHTNRGRSLLTRAQALFLDAHFALEHGGRAALGLPFNFNGTAGIWRREAIDVAGGWSADTLTEDLDLSYRAQLAGYRFVYLDGLAVPAELPERWADFRQQQARWARGSVETARKLLPAIWASPVLDRRQKLGATLHLLGNAGHGLLAVLGLLLPATLAIRSELGSALPGGLGLYAALDLVGLGAGLGLLVVFYRTAQALRVAEHAPRAIDLLLAFLLGAGMACANGLAVLGGLRGGALEFRRTPKRGSASVQRFEARFGRRPAERVVVAELVMLALFAVASARAVSTELLGALPILALWGLGSAWVSLGTLRERLGLGPREVETPPQPGVVAGEQDAAQRALG